MGALNRESLWLREVRAALGRIDSGSFGICLNCEEDIGARRLAAMPWAPLCIVCQEAVDNRRVSDFLEDEHALPETA